MPLRSSFLIFEEIVGSQPEVFMALESDARSASESVSWSACEYGSVSESASWSACEYAPASALASWPACEYAPASESASGRRVSMRRRRRPGRRLCMRRCRSRRLSLRCYQGENSPQTTEGYAIAASHIGHPVKNGAGQDEAS